MDRRTFLGALAGGFLTGPLAAQAQTAGGKVWRIGSLEPARPDPESTFWAGLRESLRERGWFEGQTVVFERRFAETEYERLPALAEELVRLGPDLLMSSGGPATRALKRATATIPIVMWNATDPVGIGLVNSLARPGGNVTGLSDDQGPEIMGKRLQLMKELVPTLTKVALIDRIAPSVVTPRLIAYREAREKILKDLALQERRWRVQGPDDIERAFTALVGEGSGAVDVAYVAVTWSHRRKIVDLAAHYRVPAIYWHRKYVLDGGLVSYGEDDREVPRKFAVYLDKILKGAKPADLPVEQPTKFELVINLKTARALGLTIPPSLLQRADQVIE